MWSHGSYVHIVVQLLSRVQLFATPWTAARQASHPSPSPGVCSNSCPFRQWYHPTISSSVFHFSWLLLLTSTFPASGSFPMSQHFIPRGQSTGASGSVSVLPMHIQDYFLYDWPVWLDCSLLVVQGTLKSLLQHHNSKESVLPHSAFFMVQLSHPYMTTGKNHSFDYTDICWQSNVSAF